MSLNDTVRMVKMVRFYARNIFTTTLKKKVTAVFSKEGKNRDPFLHFQFRAVGEAKVARTGRWVSRNHVSKWQ